MRIVVSNFLCGQYFTELEMDEGNQKGNSGDVSGAGTG